MAIMETMAEAAETLVEVVTEEEASNRQHGEA
jgi:hypothetical protein